VANGVSVRELVYIGVPFPAAVRCWLDVRGLTWRDIAERHGLQVKNFSRLLNGEAGYPYEKYRRALALELGVSREYIEEQLPRPNAA